MLDRYAPVRPMAVIEGALVGPPTLAPEFTDRFDHGQRFALWVLPGRGVRCVGSVLAIQPFGDEANLSRRVLVAQALRLAERGWTTLILDLYGTGDSEGGTDDATLAAWRSDLLRASRLARSRAPGMHVLWGTRMGALLAADALPAIDGRVDAMVLWQPPEDGEAALDSLFRLGRVGAVARAGAIGCAQASVDAGSAVDEAAGSAGGAPQESEAPQFIDLGGYRLRASLVDDLSALCARAPQPAPGFVPCAVLALALRRSGGAQAAPPASMVELARDWVRRGFPADCRVVVGAPFWSSMEPSEPVGAFEATEEFLAELAIDA